MKRLPLAQMTIQTSLQIGTKTGASYNPWMGCHKINPNSPDSGCRFCYMFRDVAQKKRYDPNVVRRTGTLNAPTHMKGRQMIFTCSYSDFFVNEADSPGNGVPGWRDEAWAVIRANPQHVFRICTKRTQRIRPPNGPSLLPPDWDEQWDKAYKHVWLGCTVEHQNHATRMDDLRNIPCTLRWVSAEPLLSDLKLNLNGFAFVVDGGESGGKNQQIRQANLDWFRSLRDQCANAGVRYAHKQHGANWKCSKARHKTLFPNGNFPPHLPAWGCRVLDGRLHDDFPPLPPYP